MCSVCDQSDKWMLRSQGNKGHAKDGIWPCCIHLHTQFGLSINRHLELKAFGAPNPIMLGRLDSFRPVELIQVVQESLSIAGYFQEPLLKPSSFHYAATALTMSIDDLLVRQHRFIFWAPVYGCCFAFSKSCFE